MVVLVSLRARPFASGRGLKTVSGCKTGALRAACDLFRWTQFAAAACFASAECDRLHGSILNIDQGIIYEENIYADLRRHEGARQIVTSDHGTVWVGTVPCGQTARVHGFRAAVLACERMLVRALTTRFSM
jgi:hypothetical protein